MVGFGTKQPETWSTREVWEFLASIDGERFTQAANTCLQNSVDGKTLIRLSRSDLETALGLHVLQASRVLAELGGISNNADAGQSLWPASVPGTAEQPLADLVPVFSPAAMANSQIDGPIKLVTQGTSRPNPFAPTPFPIVHLPRVSSRECTHLLSGRLQASLSIGRRSPYCVHPLAMVREGAPKLPVRPAQVPTRNDLPSRDASHGRSAPNGFRLQRWRR
jgi:hypothetical protein